jgi:hypothetical protein
VRGEREVDVVGKWMNLARGFIPSANGEHLNIWEVRELEIE